MLPIIQTFKLANEQPRAALIHQLWIIGATICAESEILKRIQQFLNQNSIAQYILQRLVYNKKKSE